MKVGQQVREKNKTMIMTCRAKKHEKQLSNRAIRKQLKNIDENWFTKPVRTRGWVY